MLTVIAEKYGPPLYRFGSQYGAVIPRANGEMAEQFVSEAMDGMISLAIRYGHPEEKWIADRLLSLSAGVATTIDKCIEADEFIDSAYVDLEKRRNSW